MSLTHKYQQDLTDLKDFLNKLPDEIFENQPDPAYFLRLSSWKKLIAKTRLFFRVFSFYLLPPWSQVSLLCNFE